MAAPPKNFFSSLLGPETGGAAAAGLDPLALLAAASPLLTPAPAFSSASSRTSATQASTFVVGAPRDATETTLRSVIPFAVIGVGAWLAIKLLRR